MTDDCTNPINTGLPLLEPYRTGSYLIYDYPQGTTDDHFRRGDDPRLGPNTFRASGSRQLDAPLYATRLDEVSKLVRPGGRLYVVDLRQETHLFFDGRAVSWYADKDFANVGQTTVWLEAEDQSQLKRIAEFPTTQIFCLDPANQEFAIPTKFSVITVKSAATEAMVVQQMNLSAPVDYLRLHLTDHCPPPGSALIMFFRWWVLRFGPNDWVHFHCHGGDGRTTTFMALYDMASWARAHGPANFPTVEQFAARQQLIFPSFNLNPSDCDPNKDWKCAFALQRWKVLRKARDEFASGELRSIDGTAEADTDTAHG